MTFLNFPFFCFRTFRYDVRPFGIRSISDQGEEKLRISKKIVCRLIARLLELMGLYSIAEIVAAVVIGTTLTYYFPNLDLIIAGNSIPYDRSNPLIDSTYFALSWMLVMAGFAGFAHLYSHDKALWHRVQKWLHSPSSKRLLL